MNDLETAIEEGSRIIRFGTAIFGRRPYPDSYYWNDHKEANPQPTQKQYTVSKTLIRPYFQGTKDRKSAGDSGLA